MSTYERRFERQTRFARLGKEGQERLERARVLVVGCGALGGAIAQNLARSGVGELRLVDRDVVEESNLPRQVLFEERHARERVEKAVAARETLERVGGPTRVDARSEHVDADNVEHLVEGVDLVLDGTDNLETRYLLNDVCVDRGIPWIYGGVVGGNGLVLAVRPGLGPCLACVFPEAPPPGVLPTCETAGVIQPAVALVAALQSGLALRLLATAPGADDGFVPRLLEVDAWDGRVRDLALARDPRCRVCRTDAPREHAHLHAPVVQRAVSLCGRNTVQVRGGRARPDLTRLAQGLRGVAADVRLQGNVLRFDVDEHRFTVFADGRALIQGSNDSDRALALYDRYVGS